MTANHPIADVAGASGQRVAFGARNSHAEQRLLGRKAVADLFGDDGNASDRSPG